MKKRLAMFGVALAVMMFGSSVAWGESAWSFGGLSCGEFAEAHDHNPEHLRKGYSDAKHWIMGYITAYSFWATNGGDHLLDTLNMDMVISMLAGHCRHYPKDDAESAMLHLMWDLDPQTAE